MIRYFSVWVLFGVSVVQATPIRHDMDLSLNPSSHEIKVKDHITFDENGSFPTVFKLNKRLKITSSSIPFEKTDVPTDVDFNSINSGSDAIQQEKEVQSYTLKVPEGTTEWTVTFEGNMHFELSDQKEEYARGFRETMASLSETGIYMSGASFWYPHFEDELVKFNLKASFPETWHIISQGNGHSEKGNAEWESDMPMDEIYLVGGPMTLYSKSTGTVDAQVYLREPDPTLAEKYLEATTQYIEMYRSLIGPYPFKKFALVENFWETGYGMPSFTLLGSKIIRMPFILHSSYPHEILHNWWGNSVFVDYESGNWCEGLTAYEADHLIKEQRGQGVGYRKSTLQKYRNYVSSEKDFPIADFRSRHSASTEAIGYGKTMMVFHMLRKKVGDENFNRSLSRFYRSQKGKKAGFKDLQEAFEKTTNSDLSAFFQQWIHRSGAPAIALKDTRVSPSETGYDLTGTIIQEQTQDVYKLSIPVMIQFENNYEIRNVDLEHRESSFNWSFDKEPLKLVLDPEFDVFRLLDPREIPSSIGTLFGASEILVILPSNEPKEKLDAYRQLFKNWSHEGHKVEFKMDDEIDSLPDNQTLWVASLNNKWLYKVLERSKTQGFDYSDHTFRWEGHEIESANRSLVLTVPTSDYQHAWGFLDVNPALAFPGMGRKLPHYGKYSYLAFEGDEPTNIHKGQWATTNSPMEKTFGKKPIETMTIKPEAALAELPAVFSVENLKHHIQYLAATEREGRGLGSKGIQDAANYIETKFKDAGLFPGNFGSFRQAFQVEGPEGKQFKTCNLIGMIRGENTSESVIISAHYDHLGIGWPDVHKGDEGEIHPGADDNASGVALLLEYAQTFSKVFKDSKPKKNLVFIAFSAEEAGRKGSEFFVNNPTLPLKGIEGAINLDTIGRLEQQKVKILGTGNTREWVHIFRGCGFVTGLENECIPDLTESSDQKSFVDAGIPAVQIFSGSHKDYHRPSDTADKIDYSGMVKIATFVREAIVYLLDREEPLTFVGGEPAQAKPSTPSSGRRVSFGSIPDMAFQGNGVKLTGTVPGSPAAKAGLQEGDIILSVDGKAVEDLRGFSDILKALSPGDTVKVMIQRQGGVFPKQVTVVER